MTYKEYKEHGFVQMLSLYDRISEKELSSWMIDILLSNNIGCKYCRQRVCAYRDDFTVLGCTHLELTEGDFDDVDDNRFSMFSAANELAIKLHNIDISEFTK